jgi:hypothetical protein
MPFFADQGYECVSLSLQGTGGTPGELFDCDLVYIVYCFILILNSLIFALCYVIQQYPKAPKRFK